MNRRDFLKLVASTTAAAVALPACQAATPTQAAAPASPEPASQPTLAPPAKPAQVPITLYGTEMWTMRASSNGQEYRILASSPRASAETPLPVIYILDGNGNLPMLHVLHTNLVDDGYLPPAHLVGVDYPFDQWSDYEALRARDFTPTTLPENSSYGGYFSAGSGGAPLFFQFLRDELKPAIDLKYKTVPDDSTLVGHSLGGLMAAYALFQTPNLFQRYVIGSPAFSFDNHSILNSLETYASLQTDLSARVFIGMGGNEPSSLVSDVESLTERLTNHGYPSLKLSTRVFENETHLSMIAFYLSFGLRAVFLWRLIFLTFPEFLRQRPQRQGRRRQSSPAGQT